MFNHKVYSMKNSTNFSIENFEQEAYNESAYDLDNSLDDFVIEQWEEIASEEVDLFDLKEEMEDEDDFNGIF